MDALRRNLKELKVILVKVPYIKTLLAQSKYLFGVGASIWLLGGLLPDTAYFAVTFFSSIGRIAIFIGLFSTFVNGKEDRFIMIMSTIISIGCLIIIIIELAAVSYLGSFETFLFAILFGGLAINTSKHLNNQWYEEQEKKVSPSKTFSDITSHSSTEPQSPIQIETVSQRYFYEPQVPEQPTEFDAPSEIPLQKAAPAQETSKHPMDYAQPEIPTQESSTVHKTSVTINASHVQTKQPEKTSTISQETSTSRARARAKRQITVTPTKTTNPKLSDIKRAPSIGSAPSIGRAPGVSIKPKK